MLTKSRVIPEIEPGFAVYLLSRSSYLSIILQGEHDNIDEVMSK